MANTLKFGNGEWYGKKDTILAYNDENSNYKPLPFNFSRASNATVVNKAGLIETVGSGQPRIDYKDDSEGALKLEPSRTNLVPYSEDFSNGNWAKYGTTVTSGFTSPDGTTNAFKVLPNASGTNSYDVAVFDAISGLATSVKTNSFFVKPNGQRWLYLVPPSGGGNIVFFDLQNGVVGTEIGVSKGKIEIYSDGWYRLSLTEDANVGYSYFGIGFCDGDDSFTYTQSSNSIFLYGAQLEQGSYPTSYIPTQGSAVTRLADVCNNGGNDQVINSTEGVLYFEGSALANDLTNRRITISDGTNTNRVVTGYNTTSNQIFYFVVVGGSTVASGNYTSSDITELSKIAIKFKANDFALWVDGIERHTDTSGAIFSANTLSSLQFEQGSGGALFFYGNTKDIRVYNEALTDAELIALTS